MTKLEMLREAARLMRERANAATPGPWERFSYKVWSPVGDRSVCYDCPTDADAEHIAAADPGVFLALADWLDETAEIYGFASRNGLLPPRGSSRAVAVARAYLRREP